MRVCVRVSVVRWIFVALVLVDDSRTERHNRIAQTSRRSYTSHLTAWTECATHGEVLEVDQDRSVLNRGAEHRHVVAVTHCDVGPALCVWRAATGVPRRRVGAVVDARARVEREGHVDGRRRVGVVQGQEAG